VGKGEADVAVIDAGWEVRVGGEAFGRDVGGGDAELWKNISSAEKDIAQEAGNEQM